MTRFWMMLLGISCCFQVTMNCFELLYEPLAVEPVLEKVKSPDCGAVSLFVGTARNNFNGCEVISLHYEAYTKMAHKEFMDICKEIRSKWRSIVHIAVQHRLYWMRQIERYFLWNLGYFWTRKHKPSTYDGIVWWAGCGTQGIEWLVDFKLGINTVEPVWWGPRPWLVDKRLGEVAVSENIVTVALSSPHRNESLAAMTFILDKLKERVPIWKKENYKDAKAVWKENTECMEARTPCT